MNWVAQSVMAMLCLVPVTIVIPFCSKYYRVNPTLGIFWYYLGAAACMAVVVTRLDVKQVLLLCPPLSMLWIVLLVGLVFGGTANILLFTAASTAPNSGLPFAIIGGAPVISYFVAIWVARVVPSYTAQGRFDWWQLIGLLLTITGVALISWRK